MPKFQHHAAGEDPVRLTLSIGSTAYDVRPFAGAIELRGPDRKLYIVRRVDPATVECTCPDYGYRGKPEGRLCKHARALVTLGLIPEVEVSTDAEEPQD